MNMILIHRDPADGKGEGLLRFALAGEPVSGLILDGLCQRSNRDIEGGSIYRFLAKYGTDKTICAVPDEWAIELGESHNQNQSLKQPSFDAGPNVVRYNENVPVPMGIRTHGSLYPTGGMIHKSTLNYSRRYSSASRRT